MQGEGAFLSAHARRDRFVLLGDLSHAASSDSSLVPPGLPAEAELRQRSLILAAAWPFNVLGGGTRVDATMAGPLLGLTWRF